MNHLKNVITCFSQSAGCIQCSSWIMHLNENQRNAIHGTICYWPELFVCIRLCAIRPRKYAKQPRFGSWNTYTSCSWYTFEQVHTIVHGVPFIVIAPTNVPVSHRKPASTGKSRESCGTQSKGKKRNALYNERRLTDNIKTRESLKQKNRTKAESNDAYQQQ